MTDVVLEKADQGDSEEITQVQCRAFDHEAEKYGILENRGPSGYDRAERTLALIQQGRMFKASCAGRIIGGAVVTLKDENKGRINRIFVDPQWQRKGVGRAIIESVIDLYPTVNRWGLDTPEWAIDNRSFYQKIGFKEVAINHEPISGFNLIEFVLEL